MGANKGNNFIEKCLAFYNNTNFDTTKLAGDLVMPNVISKIAKEFGYLLENELQHLPNITVYPTTVFTNTLHPDTTNPNGIYAIHQNSGSWIDYSDRGWLFRFCKKHDLMNIYHWIETIRK